MGNKRAARPFAVVVRFATEASAPTLEQVQAEAAPLVAQLLAQALIKRQQQKLPRACSVAKHPRSGSLSTT